MKNKFIYSGIYGFLPLTETQLLLGALGSGIWYLISSFLATIMLFIKRVKPVFKVLFLLGAVGMLAVGASTKKIKTLCRIDTKNELEYYKNGGILQYVLRNMI